MAEAAMESSQTLQPEEKIKLDDVINKIVKQTLRPQQKIKLNDFFDKIVFYDGIDFTNMEIRDIQTAVYRMLDRVLPRVNERGIFNIARIQPAGSMADKTSLRKYDRRNNHYIEFDFLAVMKDSIEYYSRIEEQNDVQKQHSCNACFPFVKTNALVDLKRLDKLYKSEDGYNAQTLEEIRVLSELFLREINYGLASSCDCFTVDFHKDKPPKISFMLGFKPVSSEYKHGCDKCSIVMPTGTISVNTLQRIGPGAYSTSPTVCSMILLWTSKSADSDCLQKPHQLTRFPIYVDFLPALESLKPKLSGGGYEHNFFVVPKRCNLKPLYDDGYMHGWRKSWCMAEINTFIQDASAKHTKCFQIIKFLISSFGNNISSYHVKTVALHHIIRCTDTGDDFVDCVMEMLEELLVAYEEGTLKQFYEPNVDILSTFTRRYFAEESIKLIIENLRYVSDTDTWHTLSQRMAANKIGPLEYGD